MKVACTSCGCHFPEDFEDTMKPPCNYWGDLKMGNLPDDYKERLWKWEFELPADEIAIKFGLSINMVLTAKPVEFREGNDWTKIFPDYNKLSIDEQKSFQREFFRAEDKVGFMAKFRTKSTIGNFLKGKIKKVART